MMWPKVALGEICIVDWGNTSLTKSSYVDDGEYLAVSATGGDGRIDHCEHKALTPVISAIGAQCGKLFLPREDFTAIKNTITLTPINHKQSQEACCPVFLYHLLSSVQLPRRGAGQPFISKGDLQEFKIPLPPLEEQRRIAAILDKAAELNNLSKVADQLLTDLRATRLRQLLSSEASNLSKFKYVPLSDLICGKPNNGIFRKNPEYQDPDSGGLPVVWVEQLFRGEVLELSSCKKLDATNTEIAKYGLRSGDILFCRSSLKLEGIAKPNIYVGADGQALFECHLIRISPDPTKINPIFLNECLNLPEIRAEARRLSKTSTMTTIDQDGILGITVPLPPLHIQEQFAQEFAHFQCLLAMRRKSNRAIGLVSAALASLQLCETRAS